MKELPAEMLVNMYSPLPFFELDSDYKKVRSVNSSFSLEQQNAAQNYLGESLATLEDLCSQVVLKIHHILITCQEILEMAMSIPSILNDQRLDMRESLGQFPAMLRLAILLDVYDHNPLTVTQSMIREDCDSLAAYM